MGVAGADTHTSSQKLHTANWVRSTAQERSHYRDYNQHNLRDIYLPVSTLTCTSSQCKSTNHCHDLDVMYTAVFDALYQTSMDCLPSLKCSSVSDHITLGWNEYVNESHKEARHAYIMWRDQGKIR